MAQLVVELGLLARREGGLAAIVTAVLDYPAGRANLTAFNANGTTSAVTGVSYDAQRVPNSWRGREQPN